MKAARISSALANRSVFLARKARANHASSSGVTSGSTSLGGAKLPAGFQRAEFLMEKGAVDMIVDRRELRETIARSLAMLQRQSSDAVA